MESDVSSENESDNFSSDSDSDFNDFESDASSEYDPDGVLSDDDADGCCHWSTLKSDAFDEEIEPYEGIPECGTSCLVFDPDTAPNEIIEKIMDNTFILDCIAATNEHGAHDPKFVEKIGELSRDEKGICFVRGFIAIKWHLRLLRYPQMKWAWCEDPLRSQTEIKKMMCLQVFRLMLKHFRVVRPSSLPAMQSPEYHPLQNINKGVAYLREKSLSFWSVGSKLCIDEGRIRSKSKRNPYKIRNPDKPIRMGWTVCKISDKGQHGGYFIANHVVKVGKKSYVSPQNGKNYDIVDQLLLGLKDNGRSVIMDSGFPTLKLLRDARQLWGTGIIATQRGNTAHLPLSHKENLKSAKRFVQGYSKSLHNEELTVTYWNDNNVVTFLDNGVSSGRELWEAVEVYQGANKVVIHVPKVASI